ncbi:hypothetical protein V6N11_004552 [Hibiscus sabdariffa]|uniref:Uncharacterized protein n=1 Tax=Hibiscus sabdariffa TaxID=183260 RepID=A0ABR2SGT2_9ROSI
MIGQVVKVDLNKPLLSCIGIDDIIQKLKYEGLQQICFNCGCMGTQMTPEMWWLILPLLHKLTGNDKDVPTSLKGKKFDLFGPWMVAEARCRRTMKLTRVEASKGNVVEAVQGSRFTILDENGSFDEAPAKAASMFTFVPPATIEVGCTIGQGSEVTKKSVVPATTIVHNEAYVKPIDGKIAKARNYVGEGSKEGDKRGFQIRKPPELRSSPKVSVTDWAHNLAQQLHEVGQQYLENSLKSSG